MYVLCVYVCACMLFPVVNIVLLCTVSQLDHDAGECIICLEDMVVGENTLCTEHV